MEIIYTEITQDLTQFLLERAQQVRVVIVCVHHLDRLVVACGMIERGLRQME